MLSHFDEVVGVLTRDLHDWLQDAVYDEEGDPREPVRVQEAALLAEVALTYMQLQGTGVVQGEDRAAIGVAVEVALSRLSDKIGFFHSYRIAEEAVRKEFFGAADALFNWPNVATLYMGLKVRTYSAAQLQIEDSAESEFIRHADKYIGVLTTLLRRDHLDQIVPVAYAACNLHQTIILYFRSSYGKYGEEALASAQRLHVMLNSLSPSHEPKLKRNLALQYFLQSQHFLFARYIKRETLSAPRQQLQCWRHDTRKPSADSHQHMDNQPRRWSQIDRRSL